MVVPLIQEEQLSSKLIYMSTANTPCTLPCQLILINIASSSSYSSSSSMTSNTFFCGACSKIKKDKKTQNQLKATPGYCILLCTALQWPGGLKQNPMMASSEGKSPPMSNRTIKAAFSRRLQRTSKHQLDRWRPRSNIGT